MPAAIPATMRLLSLLLVVLAASTPVRAGPGEGGDHARPASVIGDGLIIPGQRIGSVSLSMKLDEILNKLGPGFKRDVFEVEGIILYEWRRLGVWVSLASSDRSIRVISVFGAAARYHTDKDVRLLQEFDRAEAAYGKNYSQWEYKKEKILLVRYPKLGLQFGIVDDPAQRILHRKIFQIGIFKPGDLPPVRQP
jgi:hypothetical protein